MRANVLSAAAFAAVLLTGCTPEIENVPPADVVVARFDPSQSPPVVPTPNDLATNPETGLLEVTPAAEATPADLEFVAWLNTLNGFPAASTAAVTFDRALDPATVDADSVRVFDVTDGYAPVTGVSVALAEPGVTDGEEAEAKISVSPPEDGWLPGHTYAFALIAGEDGVKGEGGVPVVGSATWALIRSESSLVTCEDLTSPDCRSVTELIPSEEKDTQARIDDQTAKALQLEQLRLKYKPTLDKLIAGGVARQDIALVWSFKVHEGPIALFDPAATPPRVPVPNDLAIDPATGLVNAPIDPMAPAAQQEFTRDYLNTLDGFPVSADGAATVIGGELDPATVTLETVRVVDLELGEGETPVEPTLAYDPATGEVTVSPPETGWVKGHRYAIALTTAVAGADGIPLAAGDAFALARSSATLVDCEDLTSPDCKKAVVMAPISDAQAVGLEGLRRGYEPVLDALEAQGLPRTEVALLWVFSIVSFPEATFDPANQVIPFPNNLLLDPGTGRVNLPIPMDASPLQQALFAGLNTLDGFSTTGPFVTENSDERGTVDVGTLDEATLAAGTGFIPLMGAVTPPQVSACLNCESSLLPDGSTPDSPQQLQFVTQVPLDERATYAAFLTDDIKDTEGKKVIAAPPFALARLENPLVDAMGVSQVDGVSDEDAAALEPLRLGLKPLIDALVAQGVPRSRLALAWAFTTQTTKTALEQLNDAAGALPATPLFAQDVTAITTLPSGLPQSRIGRIFAGTIPVAWLLTGPFGTLNPAAPEIRRAPFTLVLPNTTPPAGGWPVTVFGHGLTGHRNQVFAFADSLAASGQAVIAIDHAFHGDRSTCLSGATPDDSVCADPATQRCEISSGRCVARDPGTRAACDPVSTGGVPGDLFCFQAGQGACLATGVCEGGDFARNASGAVAISGRGFLDTTNLFGTRDHFRQPVVDLAQLVRVIAEPTATSGSLNALLEAQGATALDGSQIRYAGQSLGGILGTLFTAANPTVERSLLNVPGADFAQVLLTAPAFQAERDAFLGTLAAQGITRGTPAFDEFIGIARWILDPADPQNAGHWMLNSSRAPAGRDVFIQYIDGDLVIPNPTTERLIAATNRAMGETAFVKMWADSGLALPDRHAFLLNFADPAVTLQAQTEAAAFLSTGATP